MFDSFIALIACAPENDNPPPKSKSQSGADGQQNHFKTARPAPARSKKVGPRSTIRSLTRVVKLSSLSDRESSGSYDDDLLDIGPVHLRQDRLREPARELSRRGAVSRLGGLGLEVLELGGDSITAVDGGREGARGGDGSQVADRSPEREWDPGQARGNATKHLELFFGEEV